MLSLHEFSVSLGSKKVLENIRCTFNAGDLVIITGDNGSGKSTFAAALMGLSGYTTTGNVLLDGVDISSWPLEKRAQAGIFLAFQHPIEVPGLSIKTFLYHAYRSCKGPELPLELLEKRIIDGCALVGLPAEYAHHNVNEAFSGGQKKRLELLQMLVLEPRIIILDELDSGLDAQGIRMLVQVIHDYKMHHPDALWIIITHNSTLAAQLNADTRLTMIDGTSYELD